MNQPMRVLKSWHEEQLGTVVPDFFKVESLSVFRLSGAYNAIGDDRHRVGGRGKGSRSRVRRYLSVAEGHGPVNALDQALRKDLGKYQSQIEDLELVDYKVRILNGGTEAVTRVLIESTDDSGERWSTIGVSDNIIDASFQALTDSINYKLMKSAA